MSSENKTGRLTKPRNSAFKLVKVGGILFSRTIMLALFFDSQIRNTEKSGIYALSKNVQS